MKRYTKILMFAIIGSAILAAPSVGTMVTLLTFGLGVPLLFLPALAYYMLAMLPGIALASYFSSRLVGAVLIILTIGAAALLPVWKNFQEQGNLERELLNAKSVKPFAQLPRSLEIIRPKNLGYTFKAISYPEKNCGNICQYLIESGQIDWVRIKLSDQNGIGENIYYQAGKTEAECKVPGYTPVKFPCFLIKKDDGQKADITIKAESGLGNSKSVFEGKSDKRFRGWLRYTALDNREESQEYSYSNSQQLFRYTVFPFLLSIKFGYGLESGGIEPLMTTKQLNPLDYQKMLIDLGYDLPETIVTKSKSSSKPYENQPTPDQTRALLSVLELPTKAKFNDPEMKIINTWVFHARQYKDWNPERVELVKRIILDTRMGYVSSLDQVAVEDKVASGILPIVFKQLSEVFYSDNLKQIMWKLDEIDREILTPYKIEIEKLLVKIDDERLYGQLVVAAAVLGISPKPYIERIEYKKIPFQFQAYCYLEPKGNSESIQFFQNVLVNPKSRLEGQAPGYRTDQALRALASHGDMKTVQQIVKSNSWKNKRIRLKNLQRLADERHEKVNIACIW